MKTKVILTLCVVFVWGLVPNLSAQVVAGSPEDKAFQLIDAENNVDAKNRAVQYAQKAVDITARLKTQPPQNGYSDEQWKQYVESNEQLAKSYLSYARSLKP